MTTGNQQEQRPPQDALEVEGEAQSLRTGRRPLGELATTALNSVRQRGERIEERVRVLSASARDTFNDLRIRAQANVQNLFPRESEPQPVIYSVDRDYGLIYENRRLPQSTETLETLQTEIDNLQGKNDRKSKGELGRLSGIKEQLEAQLRQFYGQKVSSEGISKTIQDKRNAIEGLLEFDSNAGLGFRQNLPPEVQVDDITKSTFEIDFNDPVNSRRRLIRDRLLELTHCENADQIRALSSQGETFDQTVRRLASEQLIMDMADQYDIRNPGENDAQLILRINQTLTSGDDNIGAVLEKMHGEKLRGKTTGEITGMTETMVRDATRDGAVDLQLVLEKTKGIPEGTARQRVAADILARVRSGQLGTDPANIKNISLLAEFARLAPQPEQAPDTNQPGYDFKPSFTELLPENKFLQVGAELNGLGRGYNQTNINRWVKQIGAIYNELSPEQRLNLATLIPPEINVAVRTKLFKKGLPLG